MISNRFSKMLSTRLPPYIISSQWSENKKPNPQINRCIYQAQFYLVPIKILYSLYPLSLSLFSPSLPPPAFSPLLPAQMCVVQRWQLLWGFTGQWNVKRNVSVQLSKDDNVHCGSCLAPSLSKLPTSWSSWMRLWTGCGWSWLKAQIIGMSPSIREQPTRADVSTQSNNATIQGLIEQWQGGIICR